MIKLITYLKEKASLMASVLVILLSLAHIFLSDPSTYKFASGSLKIQNDSTAITAALPLKTALEKEYTKQKKQFEALTPSKPFIIINTTDNSFGLYKKRELVREGVCSTGSFIRLYNDQKSWLFKTPKGVRTIQNKRLNPVWVKPDWAFIEEGLPVPPAGDKSRYEHGVLGDYAMNIGDGYMIHGTLYQRLMGQAVTHGCIRLKDDDLEAVFKTLEVGSKVYIY